MWFVLADALAAPPDREAAILGDAAVDRLSVAPDGALVAGVSGSAAFVASSDAWASWTTTPCTVGAVASGADAVWVGCDDGTVRRVPIADDGPGAADDPVTVGEDGIIGLWLVDDTLWALSQADDTLQTLTVTPVDVTTREVDADRAVTPAYRGYVDGLVANGALYLLHGTSQITVITLASGVGTASLMGLGPNGADLAPAPTSMYAADSSGALWQFQSQFLQWTPLVYGLGSVSAVGSSVEDGWVGVVAGGELRVWETDAIAEGSEVERFAVSTGVTDVATDADGYAYAATGAGLAVWTSNPWVADVEVSPAAVADGDTVTVTFSVDRDVDWSVHRGGDRAGSGEVLAEGAAGAGTVTATFVADELAEGANRLYVVARSGLQAGHARASVTLDNPPGAPALGDANLGFDDGALTLAFAGIPDADLDHYDVYVTTTPFSGADWPTGGPAFDGTDAIVTPIAVPAEGGDDVTLRIAPLTNGTTYHVAVRAFDQGGLMSPLSNVISGTPRATFTASELAGEEGGPYCATSPAGAAATAAAALLVAVRRRGVALALLAAPGAALAGEGDPKLARDLSLARGDFEVRYGGVQLADTRLVEAYDAKPIQVLQMEFGVQPFNAVASGIRSRKEADGQRFEAVPTALGFVEFDGGFGFLQELAPAEDEAGVDGSAVNMITMWPLAVDATLRAQLLDEQFVVPYVRGGFDYVLWSEHQNDGSGMTLQTRGAKTGTHFGAGVAILLDPLAPARASLLEAQSGVNDSYIVIEWRKQAISKAVGDDATGGLSFDGQMTTVGLKLDF